MQPTTTQIYVGKKSSTTHINIALLASALEAHPSEKNISDANFVYAGQKDPSRSFL
jgi:hypothetical protein